VNLNDIMTAVRAVLVPKLPGVSVVQANQPTIEGREDGPAVLLYHIGDRRYGWTKRQDTPDLIDPLVMVHTETQFYETRIQVGALGPQPSATQVPPTTTASDLVNTAAGILQSDAAIAALRVSGLAVLRVTDVRAPYMQNDRDQYEAVPSFDLVVTHEQVMVSTLPAAVVGELRMARV